MKKVAIVGATGYAGEELIRILLKHPECKITYICAKIDKPQKFPEIFPWAKGKMDLVCDNPDFERLKSGADAVFLALPHKASMDIAPDILKAGRIVIDLSADYRLSDASEYEKWYGVRHKDPANLKKAVYGLPELYKAEIKKARFIANPGCYPTAAILSLAPLLKNGLCLPQEGIIIDAKSGYSGAGRKAEDDPFWQALKDNFKAYKVDAHQHSPEIEQELSKLAGEKIKVIFVPHLLPVERGILETIYVKLNPKSEIRNPKQFSNYQNPNDQNSCFENLNIRKLGFVSNFDIRISDLHKLYREFYKDEPFVRIKNEGEFPQLKDVQRTNFCDIGFKISEDKRFIIIVSAIDNLTKGAAGQAVQNMNIACGFKETEGLL